MNEKSVNQSLQEAPAPVIMPTVGRVMHAFSPCWEGPRACMVTHVYGPDRVAVEVKFGPEDDPAQMRVVPPAPSPDEPTPPPEPLANLVAPARNVFRARIIDSFDGVAVEETPYDEVWVQWMPYQQGQAAKTDDSSGALRKAVLELEPQVARLTQMIEGKAADEGGIPYLGLKHRVDELAADVRSLLDPTGPTNTGERGQEDAPVPHVTAEEPSEAVEAAN